jgi:hypothetical protein
MKNIGKAFVLVALLAALFLCVKTSFAQCGVNFNTGYRKILDDDFGRYELDDWNNDGKPDFWKFLYNPNTSAQDVYVYLNNGSGDWNWNNPQIYPTTIPALGQNSLDFYSLKDFDGDGRTDLAIFRDGFWYVLRSYNNSPGYFPLSRSGDVPIPLYDGEIATPVVYRASERKWYKYIWQDPLSSPQIFFGGD